MKHENYFKAPPRIKNLRNSGLLGLLKNHLFVVFYLYRSLIQRIFSKKILKVRNDILKYSEKRAKEPFQQTKANLVMTYNRQKLCSHIICCRSLNTVLFSSLFKFVFFCQNTSFWFSFFGPSYITYLEERVHLYISKNYFGYS